MFIIKKSNQSESIEVEAIPQVHKELAIANEEIGTVVPEVEWIRTRLEDAGILKLATAENQVVVTVDYHRPVVKKAAAKVKKPKKKKQAGK